MTKRGYYLSICLMALIGILVALLSIPNKEELSVMYFSGKQFTKAGNLYQEIYRDKSSKNLPILTQLAETKLALGEVDQATKLIEGLASHYHENSVVQRYLARFYERTGKPQLYLKSLTTLALNDDDYESLIIAIDLAYQSGETNLLTLLLEKIIELKRDKDFHWILLVQAYQQLNQRITAMQALDRFLKRFDPEELSNEAAWFAVRASLSEKMLERAECIASSILKKRPNPKLAIELVSLFEDFLQENKGLSLLDLLPAEQAKDPKIISLKYHLLTKINRDQEAFDLVASAIQGEYLPAQLISPVLWNALEQSESGNLIHSLIYQTPKNSLEPSLIEALIFHALEDKDAFLAELLQGYLKDDKTQRSISLFAARYVFDTLTGFTGPKIDQQLNEMQPNDEEALFLARLFSSTHQPKLAKKELNQIQSWSNFSTEQIFDVTQLFLAHELEEQAALELQKLPHTPEVIAAQALIALKNQDEDTLLSFFSKEPELTEKQWLAFAEVALYSDAPLLLPLIEQIRRFSETKEDSLLTVYSELLRGNPIAALEMLKPLPLPPNQKEALKLKSLVEAAKVDPSYAEEYAALIDKRLPSASAIEKRNYAFSFINLGLNKQAEAILLGLASGKSYSDQDVQDLLYLWGEVLNEKQLEWISRQYNADTSDKRWQWLEFLSGQKAYPLVAQLVEGSEIPSDKTLDYYLEALAVLKERNKMEKVIADFVPKEIPFERRKRLGKIALDAELYALSRSLYAKVLQSQPADKEAMQSLGMIAYNEGEFQLAKRYLHDLAQSSDAPAIVYSTYGQLLLKNFDCRFAAKPYLCQALHRLQSQTEQDQYIQLLQASLYNLLDRPYQSLWIYRCLLLQYPRSADLRAEMSYLLLNLGKVQEAKRVLWSFEPEPETSENSLLSLELARLYWLQQNHFPCEALALAAGLQVQYPCNPRVATAVASLNDALGRWQLAKSQLWEAWTYAPRNEDFRTAYCDYRTLHSPLYFINYEHRITGQDQLENFLRAQAGFCPSPAWTLNWFSEVDRIDLSLYTNVKTGIDESIEAVRSRTWLDLHYSAFCGHEVDLFADWNGRYLGGGIHCKLWDPYGYTTAIEEYHRSYWGFTQTTIEKGTRDRVALARSMRIDTYTDARLLAALNAYNLPGLSHAARSYSFEGAFTLRLPPRSFVELLLGKESYGVFSYELDAEHVTHLRTRTGSEGFTFTPLPLTSRENHIFRFGAFKKFTSLLSLDAYGGYLYNSLTRGSLLPVYGTTISYGREESFQAKFTYRHGVSIETDTTPVDSYECEIRYHF